MENIYLQMLHSCWTIMEGILLNHERNQVMMTMIIIIS